MPVGMAWLLWPAKLPFQQCQRLISQHPWMVMNKRLHMVSLGNVKKTSQEFFVKYHIFSAEIGNETQSIWSWNGLKHVKTTNHLGLQMISFDLPFYFRHDSLQNPGGMGPRRRSLQRPMYPMWKPLRGPPNGYDDRKGEFCPVSMGVSVPSVVIKHGLPDNPPCISIFSGFFLFSHPNLRLWRIFDNR